MATKEQITLFDLITRNELFQRSINIQYDTDDTTVVDNFYCPLSYEYVLTKMIEQIKSGQSSFTWTGPFGSGKSSLAIFLQALISENKQVAKLALNKISDSNKKSIQSFFANKKDNWQVLNLVGRVDSPENIFKEALNLTDNDKENNSSDILQAIKEKADGCNLIVFIDELGKVFDSTGKSGKSSDIYFLQQLAELANRSGNIIVVGILHQSFMAYARNASTHLQNEWLKIQGRFVDCVISLSFDEQLYLIGQAVNFSDSRLQQLQHDTAFSNSISALIDNISINRNTDKLSSLFEQVFPLHPLVAILICQLSKKNFGQNQRSVFSFLMSSESLGFTQYLKQTKLEDFQPYQVYRFWDYLNSNLGSVILSSEYGKQWLLAQMAIQRHQEKNDEKSVQLIKIISLITMLADDTGVHASKALLESLLGVTENELGGLIHNLESASIIYFRKFNQSYSLTYGSNFDLHKALEEQRSYLTKLPINQLEVFEPIVAKKHYQRTGSLRFMEIKVVPIDKKIEQTLKELNDNVDESLVGYFCLLVPLESTELQEFDRFFESLATSYKYERLVLAKMTNHENILDLLKDSIALKSILKTDEHLLNDELARREVDNRINDVTTLIRKNLDESIHNAIWYVKNYKKGYENKRSVKKLTLNYFRISSICSELANSIMKNSFICNNELVNRNIPSPSAKGAVRELIKRMIENSHEEHLGIEKFPAEMGVYQSILLKNKLHTKNKAGVYHFVRPKGKDDDPLIKIWQVADELITQHEGKLVTADKIYAEWKKVPYGVKSGLHDILFIAYILSRRSELACYIEEEYKPNIELLLAEYLIKLPDAIGVRAVSELQKAKPWIYNLRQKLISDDDFGNRLQAEIEDKPLPIAQALISLFFQMHPLVQRTNELSKQTKQIRNILKQANDPNSLLFDDLPEILNNSDDEENAQQLMNSLHELDLLYPNLVSKFNHQLIHELKAESDESNPYQDINERAKKIFGKSGDYLLDSFISRLTKYDGSMKDAEGLIGLLAGNKPAKKWIDQDITKAQQQLASFTYQFLETEINASIDVNPNRAKVGLIAKTPSSTESYFKEAHITEKNAQIINEQATQMLKVISEKGFDANDRIALVAKIFEIMSETDE